MEWPGTQSGWAEKAYRSFRTEAMRMEFQRFGMSSADPIKWREVLRPDRGSGDKTHEMDTPARPTQMV